MLEQFIQTLGVTSELPLTFTVAYEPCCITYSVGLVGQSIVIVGADMTRLV